MTSFKPGDIVTLKSGGEKMTVTAVSTASGEQLAICSWWQAASETRTEVGMARYGGTLETRQFPAAALVMAP